MFGRKSAEVEANRKAVETAWAIHAAQSDWTGRVDAKATFAFAAESAAIATVVALTAEDRLYSHLNDQWMWNVFALALIGMIVAAGLAAWVVVPRLRKKLVDAEAHRNYIYFGHARRWNAEDLERAMLRDDILPQLTRQITIMADIAWWKHRVMQASLWMAVASGSMLVGLGLLASFLAQAAAGAPAPTVTPTP